MVSQSLEANTRTMLRKRKKFTCQQTPRVVMVPTVSWALPEEPLGTQAALGEVQGHGSDAVVRAGGTRAPGSLWDPG